jgi:xanthosine utilization system XapX-like protein
VHLIAPTIGNSGVFGSSAAARRWLAQNYPRTELAQAVLRGTGQLQTSVLPPANLLVDVGIPLSESQSPAEPALALHGQTIKIAFVSSRVGDQSIALLKGLLEKQGASVVLFPSTSVNALFSTISQTQPDLTLIYWSPYYPNIPNYLTALLSTSRPVPNFTGFVDTRLDELVRRLKTASPEERVAAGLQIREVLDETMPWIALYHEAPLVLAQKRVKKFQLNPVSAMLLNDAEVAP